MILLLLTREVTFSHRKKREAKIKREVKRGIREPNEQNPFEIFITVTDIRYSYVLPVQAEAYRPNASADITRNPRRFSATPMACAFCKTLRPLRPIYLRVRSRQSREEGL